MIVPRYFYVACSNCGRQFHMPHGRDSGFSHCDQHTWYTPLPFAKEVNMEMGR